MLLIPFVSSFMVTTFLVGFNLSVLTTAVVVVYYAGYPMIQSLVLFVSTMPFKDFDILILCLYIVAMVLLIYRIEVTSNDFLQSVDEIMALKNARIRELELMLKESCIEEGREFGHSKKN